MITASVMKELKVVPNTLRKQLKNLFEDMVKFSEKSCEKFSLYSVFILFGASFSTSVTKLYPRRNRDVSTTTAKSWMELFVTNVNGFRLAVLDLLQLSCLFSLTLIFSKSSSILVSITE